MQEYEYKERLLLSNIIIGVLFSLIVVIVIANNTYKKDFACKYGEEQQINTTYVIPNA